MSHKPGYINQSLEKIVGLQTDAPLKRGFFPEGGINVAVKATKPTVIKWMMKPLILIQTLEKHTIKVFLMFIQQQSEEQDVLILLQVYLMAMVEAAIIGDYRRVALYGVDALIEDKKNSKNNRLHFR